MRAWLGQALTKVNYRVLTGLRTANHELKEVIVLPQCGSTITSLSLDGREVNAPILDRWFSSPRGEADYQHSVWPVESLLFAWVQQAQQPHSQLHDLPIPNTPCNHQARFDQFQAAIPDSQMTKQHGENQDQQKPYGEPHNEGLLCLNRQSQRSKTQAAARFFSAKSQFTTLFKNELM